MLTRDAEAAASCTRKVRVRVRVRIRVRVRVRVRVRGRVEDGAGVRVAASHTCKAHSSRRLFSSSTPRASSTQALSTARSAYTHMDMDMDMVIASVDIVRAKLPLDHGLRL